MAASSHGGRMCGYGCGGRGKGSVLRPWARSACFRPGGALGRFAQNSQRLRAGLMNFAHPGLAVGSLGAFARVERHESGQTRRTSYTSREIMTAEPRARRPRACRQDAGATKHGTTNAGLLAVSLELRA